MQVLVLGCGVIGISTAYYLARAGHQVTVVERREGPALETSFANAGQISPGYASPWAAPGVPLRALRWLLQPHAPLAMRPTADWHQYAWLWQMFRQCNRASYERNKARMVRLAEYSRDCLDQLRADTGIDYEGRQLGTTQLFRNRVQLASARKDIAVLERYQVPYRLLRPDELEEIEPALGAMAEHFTGALHLPHDQTGDCYLFCQQLLERCRALGVEFSFGESIVALEADGPRLRQVITDRGARQADAYVLALGCETPKLLRPLGLDAPIYPLKGYSLTLPVGDESRAPRSTVLDETYKVAITRFDQRIRVGGMAELAGYDLRLLPRRRRTLEKVLNEVYPDAGPLEQASFWCGLRPTTPDGTPIVGATPLDNLFINAGHGTLGWTMACGSGALMADLLSGRTPAIEHADLALARYRRP